MNDREFIQTKEELILTRRAVISCRDNEHYWLLRNLFKRQYNCFLEKMNDEQRKEITKLLGDVK